MPVDDEVADMSLAADGKTIEVRPSMAYLSAPSTVYPVTVDPTLSLSNRGDTYVTGSGSTGNTTTNAGLDKIWAGSVDGSTYSIAYEGFDVAPYSGKQITSATLSLFQYDAGSCTALPINVHPLNAGFHTMSGTDPTATPTSVSPTVWATRPDVNTSGDWLVTKSFNAGNNSCSPAQPNQTQTIDVTKIVTGWTSGALQNFGLDLNVPSNTTDTTYYKKFCSLNPDPTGACISSHVPSLSLTLASDLGLSQGYSLTHHRLNDRSDLYINNDDGNAVIAAHDVHIHGVGLDLSLNRQYNGASTTNGSFGIRWSLSAGPDVKLIRRSGSDWFDYQDPTGRITSSFVRDSSTDFYTPLSGGVDADLKDANDGSGNFTLKFHNSHEQYTFNSLGCSSCDLVMTKDKDRNGNTITFNYDNPSRHLTSIVDTEGRSLTVHYNSSGYIDLLTDSTSRTWQYGYTGADLTSYIDPAGKTTNYSYTNDQVTTITDPAGSDATSDRPKTNLNYTGGQTTSVQYFKDGSSGTYYQFTWSYPSTKPSVCPSGEDSSSANFTTVTDSSDPQGGTTTYCFKWAAFDAKPSWKVNDRQLDAFDGDQHKRTDTFTADNSVSSATDPDSPDSSTVFTYGATGTTASQNLQSITAPGDSGDTGAKFTFAYGNTGDNQYLPTSRKSPGGVCTAYAYDTNGSVTDSYDGLSGSCSGQTGGADNKIGYNSNGTIDHTYAPNSDHATLTQATRYHYLSTGVNAGQLYYVDRPGGDDTCTTNRHLCTMYSYDNLSRISDVTDGRGNKTTYHFDGVDRTTEVDLAGATTCNGQHTNCYTYTYDGEGNLRTAVDTSNSTRTFGYDRLNRQVSITQTGVATIAAGYDGAGNLTSYANGSDSVSYSYDAANLLTNITDASGSMPVTNTNGGRRDTVQFTNGITLDFDYHKSGDVQYIKTYPTGNPGGTAPVATRTYCFTRWCDNQGQEYDQLQESKVGSSATYDYYGSSGRLCWTGTSQPTSCSNSGRTYSYNYDSNGNITSKTDSTGTMNFGYNQADLLCWAGSQSGTQLALGCPGTPTGATAYNSDDAGNSTGTSSAPITYNTANQATSVTPAGGGTAVSMGYQDQGNALRSSAGGSTFTNGPLGVTTRTSGTTTTNYTRDPDGNLIDERVTTAGYGTSTYYYVPDRLGSTVALLDSSGTDVGDYTYDPYGSITNTLSSVAQGNPWRFAGGYQDIEGDNYYHFGARYYDPTIGRFTQPDSVIGNVVNPHTVNLYAYAGGDPVNSTDLTGKSFLDAFTGLSFFDAFVGVVAGVSFISAAVATGGIGAIVLGAVGIGFLGAGAIEGYVGFSDLTE